MKMSFLFFCILMVALLGLLDCQVRLTQASSNADFFARFSEESYWRSLSPVLHIYDRDLAASASVFPVDAETSTEYKTLIANEGYVALENVFKDTAMLKKLRDTISLFHNMNIPVQFCFVYDEFWLLFMQLHYVISSVVGEGYKRLPDFWSWRIDNTVGKSGWNLHRDKSGDFNVLFEDTGLPKSLTVWIALSEANSLNSCMYVLPAHLDPSYHTRHNINSGNQTGNIWAEILQNVRALPVPAGSVLMWNQHIWHWGGRSSPRSDPEKPRISVSIEFQSDKVPAFNTPLSNPLKFPKFKERILLIMKQTLQYKHMYPIDPTIEELAREILFGHEFGSEF